VHRLDPEIVVNGLSSLGEIVSRSVARPRFTARLLLLFAAMALALSAVGIYGVIAFAVSQRTREIGIRMALGAPRRAVVWLFLREGLVLAGIGAAVGLAVSLALSHVLASQLYGVGAADPVAFVGVAGVLGAVAFLAVYFPARRATRVDPVVALRSD
jgi:putative ABC transport system permease protein